MSRSENSEWPSATTALNICGGIPSCTYSTYSNHSNQISFYSNYSFATYSTSLLSNLIPPAPKIARKDNNNAQKSSRKLTTDTEVVAEFAFWKKEYNIKNKEDSKQSFKRYMITGTYRYYWTRIFANTECSCHLYDKFSRTSITKKLLKGRKAITLVCESNSPVNKQWNQKQKAINTLSGKRLEGNGRETWSGNTPYNPLHIGNPVRGKK